MIQIKLNTGMQVLQKVIPILTKLNNYFLPLIYINRANNLFIFIF